MEDVNSNTPNNDPFIAPDTPMLAAILEQINTLDVSETRRRDMRSAITSLCRVINRRPEEVPANINWIYIRLRRIHPVKAGISVKRFKNIKSDVLKVLELCGCSRERSDWLRAPSPKWQSLLDGIPDKHDRWKLTQLAQYCSALDIAPQDVANEHVAGLLTAIEQHTFVDKPAPKISAAVRVWNRLRSSVESWPPQMLKAPRKREPWTAPLDQFPKPFQGDIERWMTRLGNPDPMDADGPLKPLRPTTLKHRRFQIQEMASALVRSGRNMEDIQSLADLVELTAFKDGLRYMMSRFDDKPTEAIHGLAMGLKAIATYHVKVNEEHLAELRRICQRLNLEADGLREKNRLRLEQLEDDQNLARLLNLPAKLVRLSKKAGLHPHTAALMVQVALAIEIFFYAPMRIGNLASLSLERHLRPLEVKRKRCTIIAIPGHEVKNGKDLHFELGDESTSLLEQYKNEARPILLRTPSEYLFPAQNGGPRNPSSLSRLITKTILEHTGLYINAHLFRSIAGKIHSMVQPGDFVTLSHVIGDSLKTAMKSYAQFEQKNSLRHYQHSVDEARRRLKPDVNKPKGKAGKKDKAA